MKRLFVALVVVSLAVTSGVATAGPLRDRLKAKFQDRLEAKQAEESRPVDLQAILPGARKQTLSYGPDARQVIDVYTPPNTHDAPVIVMVHGGAWKVGDKANSGVVENKLKYWLPKGYVLVSVNYRMLPDLMAYEQAMDVAAALRYTQSHAGGWGARSDRLILMGHSAGAHIVALLSSNPALVGQKWAGTIVLDSAVMSVPDLMSKRHLGFYDEAFGADKAYWLKASPMDQWTPAAVPMLVVCSTKRKDRPCDQAKAFQTKVTQAGRAMPLLPQDLTHEEINRTLGLPSAYTSSVDSFITSHVR
ncbi:alpha/beta hydrolase [Asticcacaulis sp. 201]|uniref:alpha/beta hydrolase n=1 Tax=Asticcacaulis sp. 201 TaxID=3028787 RepID=UPI00291621D5|nr:alpha/beta hydrolase [Asticcacaulis sp. 201]MDV6332901.1 alpha/beta hydrolase [Asticcacaulis sp. 201]